MARFSDRPVRCPIVIGRGEQMAALVRAIEQTAAGRGQSLLISGEAGIGKSRLISEVKTIADRQGWLIVEGHCFEPDRIVPYAPFIDLLRNFLATLSQADIVEILGPEARDLVKVLPELSRMISDLDSVPSLEPAQERRLTIQALSTVLLRLSSQRPVLSVIEDLHWSDETSLEALLHLGRSLAGSAVMLVMTYRDDELGGDLSHFLATVDREHLAMELPLHRLDAVEVAAMLAAITAQTLQHRFRDALFAVTDGNPFFIEEVLNTLQLPEDVTSGRDWSDDFVLENVQVPRSLHDAVQRRIGRLSLEARHVLQLASVAGRRCDFSLLQILTGYEEQELVELAKELISAQLLVEETGDCFVFRHALTQKAVYTSLLSRERRRLHQASAEAYERLHAGSQDHYVADLAYHYHEAGDWTRALAYASRAGERAQALYVPRAAIEQFSRALNAAQRLSRTPAPHLYLSRGHSHDTLGNFDNARADYEAALNVARTLKDKHAEWRALLDLGLLWAGRKYEQSATYCQQALDLARAIDDPVILAHSLNRVGNWYTNIARPSTGLSLHREALELVEASANHAAIAETLDLLGIASYVAGNTHDSLDYYVDALQHCREADDRQRAAWCLSVMALCGGNYQTDAGPTAGISLDECEQHAQAALHMSREIGWRSGETFAVHVWGMVCAARGRYDRAFELVHQSLELAQDIEHRQWMIAGKCGLGVLYLELLDARQARSLLEQALVDAQVMGSRLWELTVRAMLASAWLSGNSLDAAQIVLDDAELPDIPSSNQGARSCWLIHADLALARDDVTEALRIVDELVATGDRITSLRDAPRLARLRGEALTRIGLLEEAEVALRAAVEGAGLLERPSHGWRSQVSLARVLQLQRRHTDANIAFEAARSTIVDLAGSIPERKLRRTFLESATELVPGARKPTARQNAAQAYGGLTRRECEVAVLIARGVTNREIAERLFVSEPTVASHVSHILAKLGFSSRTQVATWAIHVGLLREA